MLLFCAQPALDAVIRRVLGEVVCHFLPDTRTQELSANYEPESGQCRLFIDDGTGPMRPVDVLIPPSAITVVTRMLATIDGRHIFDGEVISPPLEGGAVIVYEMRGMVALGERAAAPATELILHGAEMAIGTHPTFIYVDEAWRMLSDKVSADWLFDAIRTFRKRNAGITLATQSLTEIANSPYRDLLLESCPGKIFLPNPEASGAYVKEAYLKLGLSEGEIDIVVPIVRRCLGRSGNLKKGWRFTSRDFRRIALNMWRREPPWRRTIRLLAATTGGRWRAG